MKRWAIRVAFLGAIVLAGVWVWKTFFPDQKQVIKNELKELATLLSFAPNEGQLAKVANANKAASFFTQDIEIIVEVRNYGRATLTGRDDLFQKLVAARAQLASLKVEFVDINVTVDSGTGSAEVDLTAKARIPGESEFQFQELKMSLKKEGRRWLIRKVETVKTFS